jgi:hypothetical protein
MNPTQKPATEDWTPADTLRGAALYLERHGWTQGSYYHRIPGETVAMPPACALGAIGMALYGEPVSDPKSAAHALVRYFVLAEYALLDYLNLPPYVDPDDEDGEPEPPGVYSWNDDPNQTATDVITAMRQAADAWDTHHTPGGVA